MRLWPCVGKEGKQLKSTQVAGLRAPANSCHRKERCPLSGSSSWRVGGSSHRDGQGTRLRAANEEWGGLSRYPREKMLGSLWEMLCLET